MHQIRHIRRPHGGPLQAPVPDARQEADGAGVAVREDGEGEVVTVVDDGGGEVADFVVEGEASFIGPERRWEEESMLRRARKRVWKMVSAFMCESYLSAGPRLPLEIFASM